MGHVKSLDPKSEKQRHVLLPSRGKIGVTSCYRSSRHVGQTAQIAGTITDATGAIVTADIIVTQLLQL